MTSPALQQLIHELAKDPALKNDEAQLLKSIILEAHLNNEILSEIIKGETRTFLADSRMSISANPAAPFFMTVEGDTRGFYVEGAAARDFFACADLIDRLVGCGEQVAQVTEMKLIQQIQAWFAEQDETDEIPVQRFKPGSVIRKS